MNEMTPHQAFQTTHDASPLQAVIFDVDGTLADTERDGHRVAFNMAFREFNVEWNWTPALYGELLAVAGGKERIRLYAQKHDPAQLARPDADTWIARLHQLKSELYSNLVMTGAIALRPGVARLIRELRAAGVRLAVATTTTPSSLNSLIEANFGCPMDSLFEVIGAGDRVARKKPAPDIYQWVLGELGLPAPACLAIEDSNIGLTAARAAGLPTIVTVSSYTVDERLDEALSVLSDLGEPDPPARHLAGRPLAGNCVDLAALRAWHRQAQNGASAPAHRT